MKKILNMSSAPSVWLAEMERLAVLRPPGQQESFKRDLSERFRQPLYIHRQPMLRPIIHRLSVNVTGSYVADFDGDEIVPWGK